MCSILPRVQLDICEIIVSVEGVGEPAIGYLSLNIFVIFFTFLLRKFSFLQNFAGSL